MNQITEINQTTNFIIINIFAFLTTNENKLNQVVNMIKNKRPRNLKTRNTKNKGLIDSV